MLTYARAAPPRAVAVDINELADRIVIAENNLKRLFEQRPPPKVGRATPLAPLATRLPPLATRLPPLPPLPLRYTPFAPLATIPPLPLSLPPLPPLPLHLLQSIPTIHTILQPSVFYLCKPAKQLMASACVPPQAKVVAQERKLVADMKAQLATALDSTSNLELELGGSDTQERARQLYVQASQRWGVKAGGG